jgi:hypothetical protein
VNILNKLFPLVYKGWSFKLGVGRWVQFIVKKITKCSTWPVIQMDSLDKRPKLRKMHYKNDEVEWTGLIWRIETGGGLF